MPEYLAPGVYVEEVSFRSKTIEGVPTSTTGFAGMTRFGPYHYSDEANAPKNTEPRLITSFTEFEQVYGGLESLAHGPSDAATVERLNYTAHAVRAFFLNGGKRVYVSRVFTPRSPADTGIGARVVTVGTTTATFRARWPGTFGNVWVKTEVVRSKNIAYQLEHPILGNVTQVRRAKPGAVVEIVAATPTPPVANEPLVAGNLAEVAIDPTTGVQVFLRGGTSIAPNATDLIQLVELRVTVRVNPELSQQYDELAASPLQTRYIGKILQRDDPDDETCVVWLDWDPTLAGVDAAAQLMIALQADRERRLEGGNDGLVVTPAELKGRPASLDNVNVKARGLDALADIWDIAIVAAPEAGTYPTVDECFEASQYLVRHAEAMRYRIAVVDGPQGSSISEIREFRGRFDSKYAALYHPWIEIFDPLQRASQGAQPGRVFLPPSGFVTGIYARNDIERGVHKAPANEMVSGLTKLEANINKERQDVLNPEGINALRFFDGRGNRVWGARTISSDPEWKYVNVRRLFNYIESSIDRSTQWVVFEPNNERLWANVTETVSDFLFVLWRDGWLLGSKPEQAYFVRCDRTTMSRNDIDNGRLICLIGVAPSKPAEFVIFRIGQFTAEAKGN